MANLKLFFGWIPSTDKIEEEERALINEFEKLNSFSESDTFKKYNELKELVSSSDFIRKKKEIESLNYKDSEEYSKEKEYKSLKKSKDLVSYFKTLNSPKLKAFQESSEDDEKTKKSNEKYKNSKEYKNFINIDGSAKLSRLKELEDYTSSKEFQDKKDYLLDKKRFDKTDMFKQLEEYNKLSKDEDIVWYYKVKDSNKFDVLRNRTLTFSDEFEGNTLDKERWLTNYYWGDKILNDRYSVESDLQAYTESENFELKNSVLKIITKPQKKEGKVWSATGGFKTKEFAYTSGIINTSKSFRQKYGVFSAKVKLGNPAGKSAFWMLADKITPHIDVCRTSAGKVLFDFFAKPDDKVVTKLGSRYADDFYIFTLEWTSDKLVWKINNTVVCTQTSNVPQEPMYLLFSGGLDKPLDSMTTLEIDWIRVYQSK